MQFESVVVRNFDADFIYLDLLFTLIWSFLLLKKGHRKAFAVGFLGIAVNFIVDFGVWYNLLGLREIYELPVWLPPLLFFVYFSITYGMVQYSYVGVMFSESNEKLQWTLLLFAGWFTIGFASQLMPIDDSTVHIARIMTSQRILEVVVVICEYCLLVFLFILGKANLTPRRILYIFLVAVLAHFAMEITLLLPSIRNLSLQNLVFNSLVEWNMGAPIIYLILNHDSDTFTPGKTSLV